MMIYIVQRMGTRCTFLVFSSFVLAFLTFQLLMAAPFKFDVPSPDDLVSSGLQSLKMKSKGISLISEAA